MPCSAREGRLHTVDRTRHVVGPPGEQPREQRRRTQAHANILLVHVVAVLHLAPRANLEQHLGSRGWAIRTHWHRSTLATRISHCARLT